MWAPDGQRITDLVHLISKMMKGPGPSEGGERDVVAELEGLLG
jgi:hypothetical protein